MSTTKESPSVVMLDAPTSLEAVLPTGRKRTAIRAALSAFAILTLWHVFATFLWVAPVTPIRQIVPGDFLTQYMIPLYGQSWSVFAPAPINGNYTFKVRAAWTEADGSETVTDWVDATAAETELSRYNPFPPRAANAAVQQASQFKDAFDAISADAKVIAGLGYFVGDDWRERLEEKMRSYGNDEPVTVYMNQEYYTTAYATQVAKAMWGDKPERVQFEVSRTNIPDFVDRNDPDAPPQPAQIANTGWRPLVELPGQNDGHFAEIFRAAEAKVEK